MNEDKKISYTEMMDAVTALGAEFRIVPGAGFIVVSLMIKNMVETYSNIGWYYFRDYPMDSLIHVYKDYLLQKKVSSLDFPSSNGSKTLNETNDGD